MAVPAIASVRPTGTRFLVELLTAQEMSGTNIIVSDKTKPTTFQAYILEKGPLVPKDFGVEVGDRVWLDGAMTSAPSFDKNPRERGCVEYHFVKGIINEAK